MGEEAERKIYLPYNESDELKVLEREIPGDLANAESVQFRYAARDIMCIEMLELESLDGAIHFNIIQVCTLLRKRREILKLAKNTQKLLVINRMSWKIE